MTGPPAFDPGPDALCPVCAAPLVLVEVHGHGQCAACGTNIAPCCSGSGDEVDGSRPLRLATVEDLTAVLREAGAAMPHDALLNRFAQRTGCAWDVGDELLLAARERGLVIVDERGVVSLAS